MHHLVFGINFQIRFISLINPASTYLLIHLSTRPCHHPNSQHPSLLHSFTRAQTYLFNKSFPPGLFFFTHWTAFMIMELDRTYHAHQFIFSFSFTFLFVPCGRLSSLSVNFLLHEQHDAHVKSTVSYRKTALFSWYRCNYCVSCHCI